MTSDSPEPRHVLALSPEMIERIAAGEVIERPASVARELIANALDAGATDIRIETREGGLRLVRVSDNGYGIAPDDLELATRPHTTSKVCALDDLERLTTLGFRGEALSSVAAVAELTLASACDEGRLADVITLRGKAVLARERMPRARGVTATVRNLFDAMPARRAALRGPRFETARIVAVVRAYALAYPAVRFTLASDGALLLQTPGNDLMSAVAAIFSADIAHGLLPLESAPLGMLPDVRVSGVMAARPFHFPTREHIYLSVNGRPLANRALHMALEAGYRPTLRKGRHPLLIVRVTVAPERIDANIHPSKLEALLQDEAAIASTLRRLTHEALGVSPTNIATVGDRAIAMGSLGPGGALPLRITFPATRRRRRFRLREASHTPDARLEALRWGDETPTAPLPELMPLTQFDSALIVAQSAEGHLYLVDQHRAHERILYERLLARRRVEGRSRANRETGGQLLLEPLLIELTPLQARTLTARLGELSELGLELQPFGGSAFLAQDAAEEGDNWLDHVCISLACRSAIRRGQLLSAAEQRSLLADLRVTAAPAVCPHGSPIIVRHSRTALTRLFEW